ncbi:hypothetical protein [Frigoriglobus tundricola]|uniref:Uncharacterized protein n=1 Tax=Frigoriglobus tundricola TaxID=2774151 RepID=A0A6M5YI79_9BACT|nr:hypothetical protein [Frigoriglobus tundricola]QJW92953.1 hypothetical protein FTUN_0451 [Frigoriglobus tundricola]
MDGTTAAVVWLMVDADGNYEVAKDADDLQAPAGTASRLVKLSVRVPTPKAVELVGTVSNEPAGGALVAG